jgi:hypothetical protein
MKKLIVMCLLAVSSTAFSAECVNEKGEDIYNQPEVFQTLIENADSCYKAEQLASACAYGSSLDIMTAGSAYAVCEKELQQNKPSKKITATLNQMVAMCNAKYSKLDGTMYRSMNAFCNLSAIQWILGVTSEL